MKGLILAAGLGSRMGPITQKTPKPLLPFMGIPLLSLAVKRLLQLGIDEIAINCHHLAEQIKNHDFPHQASIKIFYEPTLLGTGGTIRELKSWVSQSDLLVYNADIVTNADLTKLISHHRRYNRSKSYATLLILDQPVAGKNPLLLNPDCSLKSIGIPGHPWHSFTGVHIITPALIDLIPNGFQDIITTYQYCLDTNKTIYTSTHTGCWWDLGTPEEYFNAHQEFVRLGKTIQSSILGDASTSLISHNVNAIEDSHQIPSPSVLMSDGNCQISRNCLPSGHVFCFHNSTIEPGAHLKDCIIYDSKVTKDRHIKQSILYKQVEIAF